MMRPPAFVLLCLIAAPSMAAEQTTCSIEGERIHWIADYCMSTLETDDEIAASDCIAEELDKRNFKDDCAAKRHYKQAMCEQAVASEFIKGTVGSCLADKNFKGSTVKNGGVGG